MSRHCKCHVCSFLLSSLPLDLGLTPPVPSRPVRPSSQKVAPPHRISNVFPSSGDSQPSCSSGVRVPLARVWGEGWLIQRVCLPFMVPSARASAGPGGAQVAWDGAGSRGFPQAMTAAPRRSQRDWDSRGDTCGAVYLHRRCGRRRIPGVAGWGRRAARRSRASCAAPRPPSWPRAHPSLLLPPSLVVTAWAPAQINFLDIFKTAAAGSLCAPGTLRWARRRVSHPGA